MNESLPKILFCTSEIPQSVNAGSMQLFRALQNYPGDRLMVLGVPPEKDARLLPCRYEPLKLLTYRLACTRFRGWTSGLNALNTFYEPQLGRSLRLARKFAPDLVVTVMDKLSYYKHAWALSQKLGAGLVTITMDHPQTFERAHPRLEGAFVRFLRRMYGDAVLSLGVSQEMCDYLAAHYRKPSTVYYFGPPEGIQPAAPETCAALKSPPQLTLGYAGSLGLGYHEGITALLPALEKTNTRLFVYTRDRHNIPQHPLVANRGFLPPEKLWPTVQAECDAVLLPYSFDDNIARVYRTHFPTKLSEYCWVGLPILLVGPEYATGVRWGLRHPAAALTANTLDAGVVGLLLEKLRTDATLRRSLAENAVAAGRAEFDPVHTRGQFVELMRRTANSPGRLPSKS